MRAVLKLRRLFAALIVLMLLSSSAFASENWLKRITTPDAGVNVDMSVSGTTTTELEKPSERMESYGMGLLIGDPPNHQSEGLTVSGTPDVNVTVVGGAPGFGAAAFAWRQNNDITLNGGRIYATTTVENSELEGWGGITGLRLMAAPGGILKVRSTADITVSDPGPSGVWNNGVALVAETSIYPYQYTLNGKSIPVVTDVNYSFKKDYDVNYCTITRAGGEPEPGFVSIRPGQTPMTRGVYFYNDRMEEIGHTSSEIGMMDVQAFEVGSLSFTPTGFVFLKKPLTDLELTRPDNSGTIILAKAEHQEAVVNKVDIYGNDVLVFKGEKQAYIWQEGVFADLTEDNNSQLSTIAAELGGTISVEADRARGLAVTPGDYADASVSLLPGTVISAKGHAAEAVYMGTTNTTIIPPAVVTGKGDVRIVAESDQGQANGIKLMAMITDITVSITGSGNKMSVHSTTNDVPDDTQNASAILIRPLGEDTQSTVRFEGDIDVRGGNENGVYSVPVSGGIARTEIIGSLTLTDSAGDGVYQAYSGNISAAGITDGKIGEVFIRGDLTLASARPSSRTCAVKAFDGLVLVDGDISVSGSSNNLYGVYADEEAVVVVTGEIHAPVPVRAPVSTPDWPNNARVYLWKTDMNACKNDDDHIGFVLKLDESQPALRNAALSCTGANNRFLDPVTWEGCTYYGAFADDEITVSGVPAGNRVIVTDANGNPVPVTAENGVFTFRTPKDCGAMISIENAEYSCVEGDGAEYVKGSGTDGLTFVFKRSVRDEITYASFTGATVGDQELNAATDYTKAEGSLVLHLKPEYLEKLAVGRQTLTVEFEEGMKASATFTVLDAVPTPTPEPTPTPTPEPKPVPKTGDGANLLLWSGMAALGLFGIGAFIATRRKKGTR